VPTWRPARPARAFGPVADHRDHPEDPHIIAVATDPTLQTVLPTFPLQDCEGVAAFILARAVELGH
jgi:hypothetical protein